MGKGDKRRPTAVDNETFEERWARTFGGTPKDDPEVVERKLPEERHPLNISREAEERC